MRPTGETPVTSSAPKVHLARASMVAAFFMTDRPRPLGAARAGITSRWRRSRAVPSLGRQSQKLTYRPVRLVNSDIRIGCATGIRVGNGDSAEAGATDHVWLLIGRQVRLPQWIELRRVAVRPTVDGNGGDVDGGTSCAGSVDRQFYHSSSSRRAASIMGMSPGLIGAMCPHIDSTTRHSAFGMWRASSCASTGGK
jgi:hypothetical protein